MTSWQMNRAGFFNFWYYEEEEFPFVDGKLLLRGLNASGKTVTMQTLLPVLFDGRTDERRLDPFGKKGKKMVDYMTVEEKLGDRDERIGYVWLEFKRIDADQYMTIGMGLRGNRNGKLKMWYFLILDGRRFGIDMLPYKTEFDFKEAKDAKIPLSQKEFEELVGNGGKVIENRKGYAEQVNRYLFGFKPQGKYEDMIELLVQLRNPRLADNNFDVEVIYQILSESLPPLSDDELRALTDTVESIDELMLQLEQSRREKQALQKVSDAYAAYGHAVLLEKANGLHAAEYKLNELLRKRNDDQATLLAEEQEYTSNIISQKTLTLELQQSDEQLRELRSHDVFLASSEKVQVERDLEAKKTQVESKQKQVNEKQNQEKSLQNKLDATTREIEKLDSACNESLRNLSETDQDSCFFEHEQSAREFQSRIKDSEYKFLLWTRQATEYKERLGQVLSTLRIGENLRQACENLLQELEELGQRIEAEQRNEREIEDLLVTEKEAILRGFHLWRHQCKELHLREAESKEVGFILSRLFDREYEEAEQIVRDAKNRAHEQIEREKAQVATEAEQLRKRIVQKAEEHALLSEQKESEPRRHAVTLEERKRLEESGVEFLPFYQAVDFHEQVDEKMRGLLESALIESGILDALLFSKSEERNVLYNRVLVSSPIKGQSLAEYLKPCMINGLGISEVEILDVIRSVSVVEQESATAVFPDGSYQIGIVHGHVAEVLEPRFIGQESRKRFRQSQLKILEQDIENLKLELNDNEEKSRKLSERLDRLKQDMDGFPKYNKLKSINENLKSCGFKLGILNAEANQKDQRLKESQQEYQTLLLTAKKQAGDISLSLKIDTYEYAYSAMDRYLSILHDLEKQHLNLIGHLRESLTLRERIEDIVWEVDEAKGELNVLISDRERLLARLTTLKQKLEQMGEKDIQKRVEKLEARIRDIPTEQNALANEMGMRKQRIETLSRNIEVVADEIIEANRVYQVWERIFKDEMKFGVWEADEGESHLTLSRRIILDAKGRGIGKRELLQVGLHRALSAESGALVDLPHELKLESLTKVDENLTQDSRQNWNEALEEKSERAVLHFHYNGGKVSPGYLLDRVTKNIERQEELLEEKDRELFEEVILNNLGSVIRGKIGRAKKWTNEIDQLMKLRKESTAQVFQLDWKEKSAGNEDELDTTALVKLLMVGSQNIKETDLKKIVDHFRSKIRRAKATLDKGEGGASLQKIIREILDYRTWFTFRLTYTENGKSMGELTTLKYNKFSGGEKAMAVYVPLLSAMSAHFLECSNDAPRIIALDEAFARVDEKNIARMFDLLENMGFGYIITSQALWGDYETVKGLSVCELHRSNDEPHVVAVIRYVWDGSKQSLVTEMPEGEELM